MRTADSGSTPLIPNLRYIAENWVYDATMLTSSPGELGRGRERVGLDDVVDLRVAQPHRHVEARSPAAATGCPRSSS